jgi:hypothetical protein
VKGSVLFRMLRRELVHNNPVPLSSDAFTRWGADKCDEHNREVAAATTRLLTQVVYKLSQELDKQFGAAPGSSVAEQGLCHCRMHAHISAERRTALAPLQGRPLQDLLHQHGVNMRLLGRVRVLVRSPAVRSVLLCNAVARTLCKLIRRDARRYCFGAADLMPPESFESAVPVEEALTAAGLWPAVHAGSPGDAAVERFKLITAMYFNYVLLVPGQRPTGRGALGSLGNVSDLALLHSPDRPAAADDADSCADVTLGVAVESGSESNSRAASPVPAATLETLLDPRCNVTARSVFWQRLRAEMLLRFPGALGMDEGLREADTLQALLDLPCVLASLQHLVGVVLRPDSLGYDDDFASIRRSLIACLGGSGGLSAAADSVNVSADLKSPLPSVLDLSALAAASPATPHLTSSSGDLASLPPCECETVLSRALAAADVVQVLVKTKGIRVMPTVDVMQREGRKDKVRAHWGLGAPDTGVRCMRTTGKSFRSVNAPWASRTHTLPLRSRCVCASLVHASLDLLWTQNLADLFASDGQFHVRSIRFCPCGADAVAASLRRRCTSVRSRSARPTAMTFRWPPACLPLPRCTGTAYSSRHPLSVWEADPGICTQQIRRLHSGASAGASIVGAVAECFAG